MPTTLRAKALAVVASAAYRSCTQKVAALELKKRPATVTCEDSRVSDASLLQ